MSEHAIDNAKAWFESIREMVAAIDADEDAAMPFSRDRAAYEQAEQAILESPLSIQVRSGWYSPSDPKADTKPAEYEILLTTGDPALRIVGALNAYGEPTSATLQWQDWGTPWYFAGNDMPNHSTGDVAEICLSYASHFYFGE